ncbi:hypothetical protein Tco_1089154 [Tanacetum coccineum]
MPTKIELTLEQSQQGVSNDVLNIRVILLVFTMKMEILLESTSNKLLVGIPHKGPTQEYILLPLQPHRIRIPVKDVVQDAQEQPSENASPDKAQATSTNQLSTDRPFVSIDRSFVSTDRSNTPNVSAASTSTGANADESSFVYLGGKIPIDASTIPNADLPIDPNMPDLKNASDTLLIDGIFNGAYDDDEDVGAVVNFNNMDNTIAVSPIPTLRIHKDHPKGQIL